MASSTFRKMVHSPMPKVLAACTRVSSTCSKAPLADRYISGNDMTTAASTVAPQENAIFTLKYSRKNWPTGRFTPNTYNRKNPATVGGSTSGMVKIPSRIVFTSGWEIRTTIQAARIPIKNVNTMDRPAVLIDIRIGDQSMVILPSLFCFAEAVSLKYLHSLVGC